MKKKWRRLSSGSGMTLVETLVAVLLVALLTFVVIVGSQTAVRVSTQETFIAESQTVADTIEQALSDVLRYATEIESNHASEVVSYTSKTYGVHSGAFRVGTGEDDAGMLYLLYKGEGDPGNILLLSNLSYSNLRIVPADFTLGSSSAGSNFNLYYSNGVFNGSYRLYHPHNRLLSERFEFSFRAVNE